MDIINILLVDDHPIVRSGIRNLIEIDEHYKVIAEAGDGEEAIRLVKELHPDLLVLDMALPAIDGVGVIQKIKKPGHILTNISIDWL